MAKASPDSPTREGSQQNIENFNRQIEALKKRLAQQALRLKDSNKRFRSIFEEVSIPLLTYNKTSRILGWNRSFEVLLHLSKKDIQGKPLLEILMGVTEDPRIKDLVQAVFKGETLTDFQWKINKSIGEEQDLSISTFPVLDTAGEISFGVAMFIDTTEKKGLERALLHTEKMAAMGTLASGLAHEMGTPMNVILGRAESLLRHTEEEKTAQGLMIIIEQIDRMTHMINRLLSFARNTPIERNKVDLNLLINKGIELIEQRAKKKRITVKTDLDPNLPLIWADKDQIIQMIVNLLMNAVDAIHHEGEISIQASLVSAAQQTTFPENSVAPINQTIQLLLRDTGDGVDPANLDKIFDPFFTTKPIGKGTGLGLAVVNRILREHGGQINVTSLPNQGTTFRICLPIGRP